MFVKVKFRSAGLVIENEKHNSDKIIQLEYNDKKDEFYNVAIDRNDFVDITQPLIKFESVSNMLHVLFGDRPVPTYRLSLLKRSEIVDSIAKKCYYKIYNEDATYYVDKSGKKHANAETTLGKKMVYNSHAKGIYTKVGDEYVDGYVTWSTFKRRYILTDIEKYNAVISKIKSLLNNDNIEHEMTIIEALLKISENETTKDEMIKLLTEVGGLKPFIDVVNHKEKLSLSSFNHCSCNLATRTCNSYPLNKTKLDGEFIFEVTKDQYNKLIDGPHYATFLDGGFAELIKQPFDEDDFDADEYKQII